MHDQSIIEIKVFLGRATDTDCLDYRVCVSTWIGIWFQFYLLQGKNLVKDTFGPLERFYYVLYIIGK